MRYHLLNKVSPDGEILYKEVANFRNELIHGHVDYDIEKLGDYIKKLNRLISMTTKIPNKRVEL